MMTRNYCIPLAMMGMGVSMLIVGGLLYLLYRPQTLLLFHVADAMGLSSGIGQWREGASGLQPAEFIVYNLPAGLWAASYVLITATLSQPLPRPRRRVAVAFIPLIGAVSELMQVVGLLPGTFDPADLVLYLLPLAVYAIYETIYNNK